MATMGEIDPKETLSNSDALARFDSSFLRLPISEESKRKLLWDNCAAYYGLPA
jgi:hypothetical protein